MKPLSRAAVCALLAAVLCLQAAAYGSLSTTLSNEKRFTQDAPLGSFAADAVRAATGTDVALVTAGELGLNLQGGEVTDEALSLSFPHDAAYGTCSITEAGLWAMLEISVSHVVWNSEFAVDDQASAFDGFVHVSGFSFRYDVSAPVGERVLDAALDDGTALKRDGAAILRLAAPASVLGGEYGYRAQDGYTPTDSLHTLLRDYLNAAPAFEPPSDGRIKHIGTTDNRLIDEIPVWIIIVVMLAVTILRYPSYSKMRQAEYIPRYKDDQV